VNRSLAALAAATSIWGLFLVCARPAFPDTPKARKVVFQFRSPSAEPARFERTVRRVFVHAARRQFGGRFVDATSWRPTGEGADVVVRVEIARRRLTVVVEGELPGRPGADPEARFDRTANSDEGLVHLAASAAERFFGGVSDRVPLPLARAETLESALRAAEQGADGLVEARSLLAEVVQAAPDCTFVHLELGKVAAEQGDWRRAAEACRTACSRDPKDPEAWARLALACRHQGRLAEAVSYYSRAIALAPCDPVIHNNLGASLLAVGERDGAVAHFERAAELEPLYPDPHVNLGTALRAVGDEAGAERAYRKASDLAPRDPGARIALAKLLTDAGDHRGAQQELEAAVEANPDHAAARFQFGLTLATRQKYAAAVEQLQRVLALAPQYREARYNLGLCRHYAGRHDQAIEVFEEAIRLDPDYVSPYYGLGLAYEAKEDTRLAEEAFRMALEKDPGFGPARRALKRLEGEGEGPPLAWPWGLWCGRRGPTDTAPDTAAAVPTGITLAGLLLPALVLKARRRARKST